MIPVNNIINVNLFAVIFVYKDFHTGPGSRLFLHLSPMKVRVMDHHVLVTVAAAVLGVVG
jgi:hypothetical protein